MPVVNKTAIAATARRRTIARSTLARRLILCRCARVRCGIYGPTATPYGEDRYDPVTTCAGVCAPWRASSTKIEGGPYNELPLVAYSTLAWIATPFGTLSDGDFDEIVRSGALVPFAVGEYASMFASPVFAA